MSVRVEFLGTPRMYANADAIDCEASTVGEALLKAGEQFPTVRERCFNGSSVKTGFLVGLNSRFDNVQLDSPVSSGDCIQFLSADVGGH